MARISARAKRQTRVVDSRRMSYRLYKLMPVLNFILLSAIFSTMYHREIAQMILKAEEYLRLIQF